MGSVVVLLLLLCCGCLAQDKKTAPEIFEPGIFSTGDFDTHLEFSPDQKEAYFLRITPDLNGHWIIYESHAVNGKWSKPAIAPFSGQYSDADPFITPDNQHLYFISDRPLQASEIKAKDFDVWVMDRGANGQWSAPRNLGAPVNSTANEYYPRMAADGTLYFGSEREGGKGNADIWRTRRNPDGSFAAAENLGDSINTADDEYEPYIARDQSYLIFMAKRKTGGLGSGDLYISYNREGNWTPAENLGRPINSAGYELAPKFSPDEKWFFFTSTRSLLDQPFAHKMTTDEYEKALHSPGNGLGDIYRIPASAIPVRK